MHADLANRIEMSRHGAKVDLAQVIRECLRGPSIASIFLFTSAVPLDVAQKVAPFNLQFSELISSLSTLAAHLSHDEVNSVHCVYLALTQYPVVAESALEQYTSAWQTSDQRTHIADKHSELLAKLPIVAAGLKQGPFDSESVRRRCQVYLRSAYYPFTVAEQERFETQVPVMSAPAATVAAREATEISAFLAHREWDRLNPMHQGSS